LNPDPNGTVDPDTENQDGPSKNRKKIKVYQVLNSWMFSLKEVNEM
jgi:hypothetical protein